MNVIRLIEPDGRPFYIEISRIVAVEGVAKTDRGGRVILTEDGTPEIIGSTIALDAGDTLRIQVTATPDEIGDEITRHLARQQAHAHAR